MRLEFRRVLIYGLGMMGASLSLALKKKSPDTEVVGVVGSPSSKEKGIQLGSADQIFTAEEFRASQKLESYDLVVFGVPVDKTVDLIRELPSHFQGLLTDMGSTKLEIVRAVESVLGEGHHYISSHPMCGSEESGLEFANPDLYENRLCILTRPKGASSTAYARVEDFWKFLGMWTTEIPAEDHDRILSYVSHVPHLISSLMTNWVWENECVRKFTDGSPVALTGGGFRDMTRIAGSNPKMWSAIFSSNQEEIFNALTDYRNRLDVLLSELDPKKPLDPAHWESFMERSRKDRDSILKKRNDSKNP
ncbi:prephenate dehydrogenase/arogenate dehydrogenase family protein [Leptospira wolffii]|uniref:prephenate dehydrogenase n=1 Tax=Leptospira wolffii TaxID=409998 RepID=A0A2M9Z868_9LEPT|nr:prephenate dehydrogenase/arogenate dehydrogenase family protein [Leptospira wolffii]PJZ64584.1 prephenate dehydrogenase/arogenate dehydrogenase family protein [Leptospira wolffii]TGK55170.1 prephenate dehydrogenase/arogenate dehydrogenase family protein [Leptospira wolffii]TGK70529.1 prephenate dehydrogenase/arogenate dehydrogenase family protein [Leptospira wolffii]TGK77623.1 prephenate dehydrogenase/arogenate dehydrogenase family protein [Leptospira wolffii]TGL29934.1 prephenate dehydroge